MKRLPLFVGSTLLLLALPGGASPAESVESVQALATVNGVVVTNFDLQEALKRAPRTAKAPSTGQSEPLEIVIRDELVYQLAVEAGLDKDPGYRRKRAEAAAHLKALEREEMAKLYREHVKAQTVVTDAEALDFFDRNSERIRKKLHVLQIMHKGANQKIGQDYKDLQNGVPFEEVAARRFPGVVAGVRAPWDLGYLRWNQIPKSWENVVHRMAPGQVSGILTGEGGRAWILKLVETAADPQISFDSEKARILDALRAERAEAQYRELVDRKKAASEVAIGP